MTEVELDQTVIKRTQETLGKLVKKPPLTEKLLKKPPFRFLHDVFKAVIKDTGCFKGLYTDDELNFENIKDRDDKMRFLQKMIDVVKLTTQTELNVRTSKIVAGHEPERTNELLQLMGEIIEKEMDWQKAVKAVIAAAGTGTFTTTTKTTPDINKKEKVEKTQDKPKGKTNSSSSKISKETKLKEGQIKKSTPSPDDRTTLNKKTIKTKPKEKEKVLSRQGTFEKITKEKEKEKEKATATATKKSKDIIPNAGKTKDERKRITPSPVKGAATTTTTTTTTTKANKDKIKNESTNEKIEKEIEKDKIEKAENVLLKSENKDNINNNNKSNESPPKQSSKENLIEPGERESVVELQKNNTTIMENLVNGVEHNKMDNRKTSPQQQQQQQSSRQSASSIKSRKSSANKQKSIEIEAMLENSNQNASPESLKSLTTVNEVETKTTQQSLEHPQQTIINPAPLQQNTNQPIRDIKREVPHENSRDSVGSNSNSSTTTRPRTSLRPPSARPPSARPGAPRRRDKNVEIILQPNDQIKMSNINVKLESFGDFDDDGENLVIIEDATTSAANLLEEKSVADKLEAEKLEQQGHLVQQILETQKELVQQNGEMGLKAEKDTLEAGLDANARQSSARQMNNLRDIIQNLTKSVNPFGKLMDFIPEDIDAMQLEMNMWRDNYTQAASDLKREKTLTESATEPMKNQLIQIDANIKEYLEMIDASRVKILQNSDKISKLLLEQ